MIHLRWEKHFLFWLFTCHLFITILSCALQVINTTLPELHCETQSLLPEVS